MQNPQVQAVPTGSSGSLKDLAKALVPSVLSDARDQEPLGSEGSRTQIEGAGGSKGAPTRVGGG